MPGCGLARLLSTPVDNNRPINEDRSTDIRNFLQLTVGNMGLVLPLRNMQLRRSSRICRPFGTAFPIDDSILEGPLLRFA